MMKKMFMAIGVALALVTVSSALVGQLAAQAQELETLPANRAVSGEVASRLGEEWVFSACRGDVITVTMTSEEFAPALQLFGPSDRDPVAVSEDATPQEGNNASLAEAVIAGVELAESGDYLVAAIGATVRERGAYSLTLATLNNNADLEEDETMLRYGDIITGNVTSRLGEEWFFPGCAGDVVTVALESDELDGRVELFGPTGRDPVAVDDGRSRGNSAAVEEITLEESGIHLIAVVGATVRERGPYQLALTLDDQVDPTPSATPTPVVTSTPTSTPKPTGTPTPTSTPTAAAEVCTVTVSPALNVRSGPGLDYTPPIGGARQGVQLKPLSRNAAATWLEVEIGASGVVGWVTSSARFVECTFDILTLPIGLTPPTAVPTTKPDATDPPPVANPLDPIGIVIRGPGERGDLAGDIYTAEYAGAENQPIFRNRFFVELYVYDPKVGDTTGDGIDRVEFEVFQNGNSVYKRTERTERFCVFGGGEPDCDVIRLGRGLNWPGTDNPMEADQYTMNIRAVPDDSNRREANWTYDFELDFDDGRQTGGGEQVQDLVIRFAQTGPNSTSSDVSGALVFQVEAYDPNRGNNDGDGIENVKHEIFGPDGERVYERTEGNVRYCAFAGGEPDCNIFDFADANFRWPGTDKQVEFGRHTLRATVKATDGRSLTMEKMIQIR